MAAARRRTFAQSAVQRFVASISQESVPCPSLHALRHHRLRRCAARCARLTPELGYLAGACMYHGRQSGGPKQKKWIENAAVAFRSFFGKRSGPPLPAAPSQPPSPLTGTPIITVNLAEVEGVNAGGTVHVLSLGDRVCLAPKPRSLTLSLILTLNLALRLNLTRTLTSTLEP